MTGLRDLKAKARVLVRIDRLRLGLVGDSKSVGDSVSELRVDHGLGYRVYYTWRGHGLVLLLVGGDKSTQARDILKAKSLLENLEPRNTK